MATPLTNLLRKQKFKWTKKATAAFNQLKQVLISAPILIYPDFSIPFMIETDACDTGVGAILLQVEHPVAFYSKKLSTLRQKASTYAKELWAIMDAVWKWIHYLLGSPFTIRTDHHNLGYSYSIVYKRGKENIAIDALSWLSAENEMIKSDQLLKLVCQPLPDWLKQLREENTTDEWLGFMRQQIYEQLAPEGFTENNGFIMYRHRYCVSPKSELRKQILGEFHGSKIGRHSGFYRTLYRVR